VTALTRTGLATAAAAALAAFAACGGSPSSPSPSPGPNPPVVTPNQPPVIASVQASTERAEVDTDITLTATVTDSETPLNQLQYAWSADAGTFSGTGATVTWRIPAGAVTPRDYAATLTVTETYGTADASGARPTHRVTAQSSAVRVHNSPRELGDLSLEFLNDFANSSVPAEVAVRGFSDSCQGKADELSDVTSNRRRYDILSSSLALRSVQVRADQMRGDMSVACSFSSRIKACDAGMPGCVVGAIENVQGNCRLTGVYEQRRWWLCTSNFDATSAVSPAFRAFMSSAEER
jgi:hypothetical protein